jgi:hypothetical protein
MENRGRMSARALACLLAGALILIVSLAPTNPASAQVHIRADPGGDIDEYAYVFSRMRNAGERIVIDGECYSACTLVLSKIPRDRICVTPRAVLAFHAPYRLDANGRSYNVRSDAREMIASYPAPVRAWIKRKGGLKRDFIYLRGRELASMYRRC